MSYPINIALPTKPNRKLLLAQKDCFILQVYLFFDWISIKYEANAKNYQLLVTINF